MLILIQANKKERRIMKRLPQELYPPIGDLGYVRVAAAVPTVHVGDVKKNVYEHELLTVEAARQGVKVICFPEKSLTGYTIMDDVLKPRMQRDAIIGLNEFCRRLKELDLSIIALVGLPLRFGPDLYNVAAVICNGEVIAFIAKTYLPNNGEFQECRWYKSAFNLPLGATVKFNGKDVPLGNDILIDCPESNLIFSAEICQDLWVNVTPGQLATASGAQIIFNLSASNDTATKADWRRGLVTSKMGDCYCGYVYVSCGQTESSSSVAFGGHCLVSQCGNLIAERKPFTKKGQANFELLVTDIDLMRIDNDRVRDGSYGQSTLYVRSIKTYRTITASIGDAGKFNDLRRQINPMPFVPQDPALLTQRCLEILDISVAGLVKRLQSVEAITGKREVTHGLSGGRDSILALLKIVMAFRELEWDLKGITVFTMPGFGTSVATLKVSRDLPEALGVTLKEVSIVKYADDILDGVGHERPCQNPKCLKCQNIQARLRTNILMTEGFDVGTGNMSEAYHGYSTYGADQLSMYNANAGDPKTLVNFLIKTIADSKIFGEVVSNILYGALELVISAELIRLNADGSVAQITEQEIGPYNLLDYIMSDDLRNMFPPTKIFFLACRAYDGVIEPMEILKWLESSYKRFYGNQFKRDAVANGVKTGSVSVDPRGDMRRPSDMLIPTSILEELANIRTLLNNNLHNEGGIH